MVCAVVSRVHDSILYAQSYRANTMVLYALRIRIVYI
jgi:hypothetical protein